MKTTMKAVPTTLALAIALATSLAHAQPATTEGAAGAARPVQDDRMAEARKQFQAGVNLLEDPDGAKYEEAYNAFKKAYELSQSSKVLGNVGFCAMHLERDGEAIDAYSAYLRDVQDVSERERAQIQRDLATLTSTVARVQVVVKRPNGVRVERFVLLDTRAQTRGVAVENSYAFEGDQGVLRVRPGRHSLKVKIADEVSVPVDVQVEPASSITQELSFVPPAAAAPREVTVVRTSPSLAGPVVLGVTGLLAIGAGAATGLLARGKTDEIESNCPGGVCPASYDLSGERGTAKTFSTVADAAFIGGGTLVGGALLWYLLLPKSGTRTERGEGAAHARRASFTPSASCTSTGCGLQLQGGF